MRRRMESLELSTLTCEPSALYSDSAPRRSTKYYVIDHHHTHVDASDVSVAADRQDFPDIWQSPFSQQLENEERLRVSHECDCDELVNDCVCTSAFAA